MADLFLIAHKVRSQPAFDVAIQLPCVHCQTYENTTGEMVQSDHRMAQEDCIECDQLGFWWIIPTSGHRAYPYQNWSLTELLWAPTAQDYPISFLHATEAIIAKIATSDLPDHYPTRSIPTTSLIDSLGLRKPKAQVPTPPVHRRF